MSLTQRLSTDPEQAAKLQGDTLRGGVSEIVRNLTTYCKYAETVIARPDLEQIKSHLGKDWEDIEWVLSKIREIATKE